MVEHLFLEPLDVLFLRGNKLFGDAGAYGEALMPPWPSVAAGAIRSQMLAEHAVDLRAFATGTAQLDEKLKRILGTPGEPGSFRISLFTLARRVNGDIEPLYPLPADLVALPANLVVAEDYSLHFIRPRPLPKGLKCSNATPRLPVLAQDKQSKAKSGLWLTARAMADYLDGRLPGPQQVVPSNELWQFDPRLGIALDPDKRSAAEGMIYTAETIALRRQGKDDASGKERFDTGFLATVTGAEGQLPAGGLVRLGGDGRSAAVSTCEPKLPEANWSLIGKTGKFRLVLASPGLFEQGWRLPGLDTEGCWHGPDGCTAKLAAACVSRSQVISGWDLAKWEPKPALRSAPIGSVYWFEDFEGDLDSLRKLVNEGFWAISGYPDRQRQAEGFNNVMVAAWPLDKR